MAPGDERLHLWNEQGWQGRRQLTLREGEFLAQEGRDLSPEECSLIAAAMDHYLQRLREYGAASEAQYASELPEPLRERALSLLHTALLLARLGNDQT